MGIATQALAVLLNLVPARPLYARAARDNAGRYGRRINILSSALCG